VEFGSLWEDKGVGGWIWMSFYADFRFFSLLTAYVQLLEIVEEFFPSHFSSFLVYNPFS
jgi:hypothetical protein